MSASQRGQFVDQSVEQDVPQVKITFLGMGHWAALDAMGKRSDDHAASFLLHASEI
ncbi:hypothetical protein [Rhodococcus sp. IEGM 1307]|uniref:hypothetical protein n=1 Tax=Rhodococcus sp. IEGM 1307 TaxID=3047091 RepID=UPI0024B6DF0F|nr:hypothetical protein [Rhodococcus sp. IEGM 1307]MDI9979427.1 hypothetical protein [Rhodococcus sp. IEGM 1307]